MKNILSELINVIIATGTVLSIYGLEIVSSPIEETFIKGKSKKGALIEIVRPRFLKVGVFLVISGSLLQVIIFIASLWGGV